MSARSDTVLLALGQPGSREREKTRDKEDLGAVASDFALFKEFFRKDARADVVAGSTCDADLTKEICVGKIRRAFGERASVYMVAYFGHGQETTGDWEMADGWLTFGDLFRLWQEKPASGNDDLQRLLFVFADCCFSGHWVVRAQQQGLSDVFIQTSCNFDERAVDGRFTPLWLDYQSGGVPASTAFRQLAPHVFRNLKIFRKREQHPQVYSALDRLPSVGGLALRLLDDRGLSLGCSGRGFSSEHPWWNVSPCGDGGFSPAFSDASPIQFVETHTLTSRDEHLSPVAGIPSEGTWTARFLDTVQDLPLIERICEECFHNRPLGMTPADLVYLYDAFQCTAEGKRATSKLMEYDPLRTCKEVSLVMTQRAADTSSPHQAVYAQSDDGAEEVIVFNKRHPRGVLEPPRCGERLDSRQGPLLQLYEKFGAIQYDKEAEYTKFLGPYVLQGNKGLAALRVVAGKCTTPEFAANVLQAVTELNVATSDVPYAPFFASDQGCGRVSVFLAYIASDDLAAVYRSAGFVIERSAALRELWPLRPPDGNWWQCHGHLVPIEPFLAYRRVG